MTFAERYGPDKYEKIVALIERERKKGSKSTAVQKALRAELGVSASRATIDGYLTGLIKPAEVKRKGESVKVDTKGEAQTVEVYSKTIRTVDDALAKANIDKASWEVERCIVNHYEVGAKTPDGAIAVEPLWQVKVWCKPKRGFNLQEFRDLLVEDIKKLKQRPAPKLKNVAGDSTDTLGVLILNDVHIGSLVWAEECGENYDTAIAVARFREVATELLARAKARGVTRIVMPIGNDAIHWDHGGKGIDSTTSGTPLQTEGRFQKVVREAVSAILDVVRIARQFAEVDLIGVPGNHDTERTWFLLEIITAALSDDPGVTSDNRASLFKYYPWGVNYLGFTHGTTATNNRKRADLAQTMIEDRPESANALCKDWFLGHLHHERELVSYTQTAEALRSVVIRTTPAIAATDAWHKANNFSGSVRAGELHYYHARKGRVGYDVHVIGGYDD